MLTTTKITQTHIDGVRTSVSSVSQRQRKVSPVPMRGGPKIVEKLRQTSQHNIHLCFSASGFRVDQEIEVLMYVFEGVQLIDELISLVI